jgi:hypothetical protein
MRNSSRIACIICITSALVFLACTPHNLIPVWRPWTRSIGETGQITPDRYSLRIEGASSTTVGDPEPVDAQLELMLEGLLSRRGFTRDDETARYSFVLNYRAGSQSVMNSSTMMRSSSSTSFLAALTAANAAKSKDRGLGVAIATLIGVTAAASSSSVVQSTSTEQQYDYAIALSMKNSEGRILWSSDAVWNSYNMDVLREAQLPLQLIISELQSNEVAPHVARVREDRVPTYFALHCRNRWFSSPALPYRIRFVDRTFSNPVKQGYAYPAFVDLLENAEHCLPTGQKVIRDIADRYLWRTAMLGGEYLLGPIKEPVKVLIELETDAQGGYTVERAYIATDEQYSNYLTRLAGWKSALREYYNIYD